MDQRYRTTPLSSAEMPPGIPYIIGNEAAERFSFYGMKAILAVFMTKYLLAADGSRDVMSDDEAKTWVHLFVASAYFFPLLGAILSDWLLGKYRTILGLSIVYCLGHLALALDATRLGLTVGLTLIALGSGGIKPCVSAHVGDQFGRANQRLLSKVFGWFYFSINLGAFASTLLTPWLLEWFGPRLGPHVAFGVPGLLMLTATWVFWLGRRKFIHIPPAGVSFLRETLSRDGRAAMRNLIPLYLFVAMFWSLFDQTASAWVLQAEQMDRRFGMEWLSSQIQAVNPILILLFIPLFSYIIYPALDTVFPLTPLRKVAIGFFLTVPAFAVPAWIESEITGGRTVRFQTQPASEGFAGTGFQSTSTADAERWSPQNLIDGKVDGSGWISSRRPAPPPAATREANAAPAATPSPDGAAERFFPQEVVIHLRERKSWEISSVRLNPYTDLARFFRQQRPGEPAPDESELRSSWARDVEILAADSRVGPWTSLARISLRQADEFQEVGFEPVSAEYVMVRVHSNRGGEYVSLGEVEVIAAGELPAHAHPHAAAVWPNVAATGHRPPIVWQLLAYAILTAAEVMVSITCLEFSYTQAPKKMKSFVMSLYLLSVSAGNAFTSVVNQWIQNDDGTSKLPGASYYWFFTGTMLATAVVFLFFARTYRGQTYIQDDAPPGDAPEPPASADLRPCPFCGSMVSSTVAECASCGGKVP